jgi:hypothetical protein
MKRNVILALSIAAAAVLVSAWVAREPAPPAPPFDIATTRTPRPTAERTEAPAIVSVESAAASRDRDRQIALEIESALLSNDASRRETAFGSLLPELLGTAPERLVDMVSRQPAGDSRDALSEELARQWIVRDTERALAWLQSLGDERAAARGTGAGGDLPGAGDRCRRSPGGWPRRRLGRVHPADLGRGESAGSATLARRSAGQQPHRAAAGPAAALMRQVRITGHGETGEHWSLQRADRLYLTAGRYPVRHRSTAT